MNDDWVGELLSREAAQHGTAACSQCGRQLPSDSLLRVKSISELICSRCTGEGSPLLEMKCRRCGASNLVTDKACHNCGRNFHKNKRGGGGGGGGVGDGGSSSRTEGPGEKRARESGLPKVNIIGGRLEDHGIGYHAKVSDAAYKGFGEHGQWAVSSRMNDIQHLRSAVQSAGYKPKFETVRGDSSIVVFDE